MMQTIKNILAIVGLVTVSGFFIFAAQKAPSEEPVTKDFKDVNDYNVYALEV